MKDFTGGEHITLYFHDDSIAAAFGELLSALGFQTHAIDSLEELALAKKVITEPLFYEALSAKQKQECLLIGNQYSDVAPECPIIRQPLTPEKIQAGLQAFLGAAVSH